MTERERVTLIDALHNLCGMSGSNAEYARGVLVGTVAGLMATGRSFEDAIELCSELTPRVIMAGTVPDSWIGRFDIDRKQIDGRAVWVRKSGR